MKQKLKKAITYYDQFSKVYDWLSPRWYYEEARKFAIEQLHLNEGTTVLNLPCGTGQNFELFQKHLKNTGQIIGIDLSDGMLAKAKNKISKNEWTNIDIIKEDATNINPKWLIDQNYNSLKIDAVFCDLGLSGFPDWKEDIDNLYEVLAHNGRFVIMDWYLPVPSLKGDIIKWIGKGEVARPLYQYLSSKSDNFHVDTSFNRGGVFVATAVKF